MKKKICFRCEESKPIDEYRILKDGRYFSYCNDCKKISDKEYRIKNKEKKAIGDKKYREENKEKIRLQRKKYRENNKEKIRESKKNYREKNREKLKEIDKKYYEENKTKWEEYAKNNVEKLIEKRRIYYQENKEYFKKKRREYYEKNKEEEYKLSRKWIEENRDKFRERNRKYERERTKNDLQFKLIRTHRKRVSYIFKELKMNKKRSSKDILGAGINEVIKLVENQFEIGMSWENYGEWHIDHVIPLSSANNEEELEALFFYINLQPMWADENLSKGANFNEEDKLEYIEWYNKNIKEKRKSN